MSGALARYRVLAYLVGVGLVVLVFVAMPLRYLGGNPSVSQVVSPIHGFLYMAYLVVALDLAVRCQWPVLRTVGVLLAGTVPFLSFVVERRVTRRVRAEQLEPVTHG